ncbi:hypothetical protein DA803_02440 [[Mycoplasma] phocae]|uniref:Uncharacterized protein n=1 Tax=[Mycoplasma] phocae TaxID=142651 RepID=A0A2Z5IR79_9BACT|nr:hypothetical protein [[Mycoplasma] phocae]AXE60931.1 hypothetical protein DA803_02440 [[Mycoplasma] phocae]
MNKLTILLSVLLVIFIVSYLIFIIHYLSRTYLNILIDKFNKYKTNLQKKLFKINNINNQLHEFYSKSLNFKKMEDEISKLISDYERRAILIESMIATLNNEIDFHLNSHHFWEIKCFIVFKSKENEITRHYKQINETYQKIEKISLTKSNRVTEIMVFANNCLNSYKKIKKYKQDHSRLSIFDKYFYNYENRISRKIEKLLSWFNKGNFDKRGNYISIKKQELKLLIDQYYTLIATAFNYIEIIENDINDKVEIAKNTLRLDNPNFEEWQIVEFDNYKNHGSELLNIMKNEKIFSWSKIIKPKLLELCKTVNKKYNEVIFERNASRQLDSVFPEIINFINIVKKQHRLIISQVKIDDLEYFKKMNQIENKYLKLKEEGNNLFNREKNLEYQSLLNEVMLVLLFQNKIKLLEGKKRNIAIKQVNKIKQIFYTTNAQILATSLKLNEEDENLSALINQEFEKYEHNDYNYLDVERLTSMIIVFVNNFNSNLNACQLLIRTLRKIGEKASTDREIASLYAQIEKLYINGDYLKGVDTLKNFIANQYN